MVQIAEPTYTEMRNYSQFLAARDKLTKEYERDLGIIHQCIGQLEESRRERTALYEAEYLALRRKYAQ